MRDVKMSGVSLRQAKMGRVQGDGVVLSDVDLTGADLTGAELRDADLSNACLDDADLREARLPGTRISWKALKRARFVPDCLVGAVLVGRVPGERGAPDIDAGIIEAARARQLYDLREREVEQA